MRSGAASTWSIEHSSGSLFINQYFILVLQEEKVPRRWRWARLPNPAKQGGRLPVTSGSSGTHEARDDRNSDARSATWGSYRFGKCGPGRTPQGTKSFLKQFLLLCNRRIDLRL